MSYLFSEKFPLPSFGRSEIEISAALFGGLAEKYSVSTERSELPPTYAARGVGDDI